MNTTSAKKETATEGSADLFLVTLAAIATLFVTWKFGNTAGEISRIDFDGWKMLLTCGTGWVVFEFVAICRLGEQAFRYMTSLAIVQVGGALVVAPFAFFGPVAYFEPLGLLFTVLAACVVMFMLHVLLAEKLGLSHRWTLAWALAVFGTAALWLLVFFREALLPDLSVIVY